MSRDQKFVPTFSETEQCAVEYCDFDVSNLGAIRLLVFDRKWIFTIPQSTRTILHQYVKFKRNRTMRGSVIEQLSFIVFDFNPPPHQGRTYFMMRMG